MTEPPESRVDQTQLDGLVTWKLIRAARRWEQALTAVLAELDLTPVQFGVLAQLAAHPSLTQSELARRVLMRPQSMNHLLDTLVGRGWVRRDGTRGSGRPNPVSLTPAGTRRFDQAWPVIEQVNSPAGLGLTSRRIHDLDRTLQHLLTDAADRVDP